MKWNNKKRYSTSLYLNSLQQHHCFYMYKILLLFLLLAFCDKGNHSIDYQNFKFEKIERDNAQWFSVSNNATILRDTTDFIEGKSSLSVVRKNYLKPFESYIFQTLNLPTQPKNVELSIYSKSLKIEKSWLKLICLDFDENIKRRDSINMITDGKWKMFSIKIQTTGVRRIYIEISAKSGLNSKTKDNILATKFSVDNLQIKLDKKDFDLYKDNLHNETSQIEKNRIFPVNTLDSFKKLNDFDNHLIFAFGESVHGSKEIHELTLNAIMGLIKNNNCKLVLMEFPFEVGLRLNQFVEGKTAENIENLLFLNNIDIPSFSYFFNWLRDFNRTSKKKVTIMGIDENKLTDPEDNLFAFLKKINPSNSSIEKIIMNIKRRNFEKAIQITEENFSDIKLKECIKNAIMLRAGKLKPVPSLIEGDREYTQYKNVNFCIETFIHGDEKTAIFAHLGHVNKKNSFGSRFSTPSLGNYLYKKYLENYFVIAILLGNGTITSFDQNGYGFKFHLISPIKGSLEDMFMKFKENIFYYNISKIESQNFGRFIGATYSINQFYPYSHIGRFDGIFFIKNSTSTRLPESWPKSSVDLKNYLLKLGIEN